LNDYYDFIAEPLLRAVRDGQILEGQNSQDLVIRARELHVIIETGSRPFSERGQEKGIFSSGVAR